MTYLVTWSIAATETLNRLLAATDDRDRLTAAAAFMDMALRRFPNDLGESRFDNRRLWYADVLGMYFRVDDNALTVRIIDIQLARRR